ncbi:hypothetical protein B0T16DRAFT_400028 [Cercophora newfieldiana]|uniref:Uncharacterized protein n=1 Tax=Cercophora newfieldiana TaxID=92897 RepID=A0AA40CYX9_9PEZI|nr:hypothetical protein B0T16DRAFT_400028 [Cercophora newfieldiana]
MSSVIFFSGFLLHILSSLFYFMVSLLVGETKGHDGEYYGSRFIQIPSLLGMLTLIISTAVQGKCPGRAWR